MTDSITWEAPDGDHPARRVSRRSMAAVAAGRKDEWLALFAPDAVVQDPVGPSMMDPSGDGHRGHEGIRRWWDQNFGAVSRFHFLITDSFANGPCCANIASITMWLGDSGATPSCRSLGHLCRQIWLIYKNVLVEDSLPSGPPRILRFPDTSDGSRGTSLAVRLSRLYAPHR